MLVSTLRPSRIAAREQPAPRWQLISRGLPLWPRSRHCCAATSARCWWLRPWKP